MPDTTVISGVVCTLLVRLDGIGGCLDTAWTALGQRLDSVFGAWRVLGGVFFGVANECNPTPCTEMSSKRLDNCCFPVPIVEGYVTKM